MKLKHWKYFAGPNVVALRSCVVAEFDAETADSACLETGQLELAGVLLGRSGFAGTIEAPEVRSQAAVAFVAESAIALQRCLACPVSWWVAGTTDDGIDEIAFETMRPVAAKEILACALVLLAAAQGHASEQEFAEAFEQMRLAMRLRLHHYVQYDRARTAASLGIENRTGFDMHYSYTRLGQGRHTRLLAPGYSDATSHLGKNLAGRKDETVNALLAARLPVAMQRVAENEMDAVSAANAIGYPVVVKPLRGNRGRAVAVNLGDDASVRQAFRRTEEVYPIAVVEKYLAGVDFRLLVINGAFVAALRRPPPTLRGDGVSSVGALIGHENQGERRNGIFLPPLSVDSEVLRTLEDQGLELDSVPEQGCLIHLRRAASPESIAIDVSDDVHPDNQALAVFAAEACGLDVAGVDFISTDIATSWRANSAGIVEVNAGPGVDLHMYPQAGKPRDISWHMIRTCVPARGAGRIPLVMVTGHHGKQSVSIQVLNLLSLLGYCPGFSGHGASRENGISAGDGIADVVAMLANKGIRAGVFSVSMRILAEEGCPVGFPAISILTDERAWSDGAAASRVESAHALAVDIAASAVIIDGTRPRLRKVAARRPPWQVGYVWSPSAGDASLDAHLRAGGWAVRALGGEDEGAWITLCQGRNETPLVALNDLRDGAREPGRLREALFAVAAAVALGASVGALSRALPAAAYAVDSSSTLAIDPFGLPATAACDPRDQTGLRRLRTFSRADTKGKPELWVMIRTNDWMMDLLPTVIAILDSPDTRWCCVEPDGHALAGVFHESKVDPERVLRFGSLCVARDEAISMMRTADVLALIELNEAERRGWCVSGEDRRPPLMTVAPDAADSRWQARDLAEIFRGFWVSGPGDGWAVQEIARDHEHDLADKLVVVSDGVPGRLTVAETEDRVRVAFAKGAAAVVARAFPIDLPRYQRVLVCDDIERGMRKLQMMTKS